METLTSGARRTIAILRGLCARYSVDFDRLCERLTEGFFRYGPDNHLSPEFDLAAEWQAEVDDVLTFPALAVSRGEVADGDPALAAYMQAARRLQQAHAVMMRRKWGGDGDAA